MKMVAVTSLSSIRAGNRYRRYPRSRARALHYPRDGSPDRLRAIRRRARCDWYIGCDRLQYACTPSCAHFGNRSGAGATRRLAVLARFCPFRRKRRQGRQSPRMRQKEEIEFQKVSIRIAGVINSYSQPSARSFSKEFFATDETRIRIA